MGEFSQYEIHLMNDMSPIYFVPFYESAIKRLQLSRLFVCDREIKAKACINVRLHLYSRDQKGILDLEVDN